MVRLFGRTWGHDRQREELSASLDGRLSAPEYAALERHLAGCDACREELDGLRAAVALLRAAPTPQTRRSFALTPAMLETAPARPWLTPPARLSAPALSSARWATAVAATLLFTVVSYDAGQNMLVYANVGNANQNATSAAMPVTAPQAETHQLYRSAPGAENAAGGGAGGGIPAPHPPVAPAAAPALAPAQQSAPVPQAAPVLKSAPPPPPPAAADSAAGTPTGASSAAAPSGAPGAAGPAANDGFANSAFGAIHPQPQTAPTAEAGVPPLRWLQLALFSILTSSGFLWWWGRRPA
ncbi:MAG: zf-HC2 domain-containing protein [Chloroflexi bacterium]|nr:zf-HC2 domain-containing protein [Chloroflexota bacterium]